MEYLCKVLRHEAPKLGLSVHPGGYVYFSDLKQRQGFGHFTENMLRYIVDIDEKGRYHLKMGEKGLMIRANYGHSFPVRLQS